MTIATAPSGRARSSGCAPRSAVNAARTAVSWLPARWRPSVVWPARRLLLRSPPPASAPWLPLFTGEGSRASGSQQRTAVQWSLVGQLPATPPARCCPRAAPQLRGLAHPAARRHQERQRETAKEAGAAEKTAKEAGEHSLHRHARPLSLCAERLQLMRRPVDENGVGARISVRSQLHAQACDQLTGGADHSAKMLPNHIGL